MKIVKLIGISPFLLTMFILALGTFASAQNVTVNPGGGSYATLQAAFDAINAGTHTGAVTVEIVGDTTETATAALNASGTGSASYTSVVITPSGGPRTVSGSLTGAIIKLNGADNVTIDGRIKGAGRNLTVSNASIVAASAAIWVSSTGAGAGATNNVIRNLEVAGGVTNTNAVATFGIIMSGPAISVTSNGPDNDNNQFIFNRVIRARYGIVTRGEGAANLNQGTVIDDNIVGPEAFGPDQIGKVGILAQFENGCNINRNTLQFIGGLLGTTTAGADRVGIGLGGESWAATTTNTTNTGFIVTRNRIHDVIDERTFSAAGIVGATTNGGNPTANLIANNMIYNVRANGTAGDHGLGIGLGGGAGDTVVFNSISLSGDVDPVGTTVSTVSSSGFRILAAPTNLTARNNVISVDFSSDTATLRHYAIVAPSAAFAWGTGGSDNNVYFFNSGNPQMVFGGLGTATPFTDVADLTAWRATFTPNQDANSRFGIPGFVSPTADLHIAPGTPTPVSDAGTPIPGVTDDFDGETRSAATPDAGADEGTFTPQPANDIAVTAIIVPAPSSVIRTGGPLTPQASFSNVGTATQTNVSVRFTITGPGGFSYSNDQVIASITSGGTATVTFAATPTITADGPYITTATILTADSNLSNDTITAGFQAVTAGPFVVNTTNDTLDATPGDGICADAVAQCSFRAAVSEANAFPGEDIITLPAGDYTQLLAAANEDLNAGGDWDITSVITVNGADQATTILQAAATAGTATERVLNVRLGGNLTLNNATVRHGRFNGTMTAATRGAGIENNATLVLNNVTVRDNQVTSTSGNPIGAGIHNAGTLLILSSSTVTANANLRVTGGSAFGGGISSISASTIHFINSSISGNSATTTSTAAAFGFGAGVYLENLFTVNATNTNFNNNIGTGVLTGGGSNGSGVRALSNIGAAVFNATDCTFSGNVGTGGTSNQGVGLQFFTVTAGTLTATLDRVTVDGNSGNSLGVGINVTATGGNASLNILNSTVSNNVGATNGGGLFVDNTGGSASSTVTANITNSTFSGNLANGNGGAIGLQQTAAGAVAMNLNYATIAANRAENDNAGAGSGGGISVVSGTMNLKNTVVADNTLGTTGTAPDISGVVVSQDYNHIEDPTGATITGTTTNNTTGDALLGALANNGGTTLTHLPGVGSPVINAIPIGTNDCGGPITSDQRGTARPSSTGCEKGSVEVVTVAAFASITGRVTTSNGRGIVNARISISGGTLPAPLHFSTATFGYYHFDNLQTGQTYTVTIDAKRYTFTPDNQSVLLNGDTTVNFVANP
jgi:CSLREA domain-containing protein